MAGKNRRIDYFLRKSPPNEKIAKFLDVQLQYAWLNSVNLAIPYYDYDIPEIDLSI